MPDNQTMSRLRSRTDRDPDAYDDHDPTELDDGGADRVVGRDRVRGSGRRPVRGTRMLVGTVLTVILLIAAGLAAYFTPLMSVRSIDVSGTSVVSRDDILAAANITSGTPLLQVDTRPAAQRIAAIPRIKTVRVARGYPSTIDITVVERTAVAYEDRSGTAHLIDVDGVDFAQQRQAPTLPKLTVTNSSDDTATRAALGVVAGLPEFLSRQVVAVSASSAADVRLTLRDRKSVVWGSDDRGPEKARTLRYLLTRAGSEYNVTAPENPTFR